MKKIIKGSDQMKIRWYGKKITAGLLLTVLMVPTFSQGADVNLVSENIEIIPVRYEYKHWAQPAVEILSQNYDIGQFFEGKHLNDFISAEDFQILIQKTIDKDYNGVPDALTREAVVYELVKIWAKESHQDLNTIGVIRMLIYSDTDRISPDYNHAITIAYMKNIAKGKGSGIFDPKAKVSYGELAALINNTIAAIEKESSQQDIASEKFETRGSYDIKDDKVILDFELMNHYNNPKDLMFSSGQQFEISIIDEEGNEVYRYSDGKFFTMALVYKTINPGESLKWQDVWDMTNKDGEKVKTGKYTARISILCQEINSDEAALEESVSALDLSSVLETEKEKKSEFTTIIEIDL